MRYAHNACIGFLMGLLCFVCGLDEASLHADTHRQAERTQQQRPEDEIHRRDAKGAEERFENPVSHKGTKHTEEWIEGGMDKRSLSVSPFTDGHARNTRSLPAIQTNYPPMAGAQGVAQPTK